MGKGKSGRGKRAKTPGVPVWIMKEQKRQNLVKMQREAAKFEIGQTLCYSLRTIDALGLRKKIRKDSTAQRFLLTFKEPVTVLKVAKLVEDAFARLSIEDLTRHDVMAKT